jgi:hypothetical protein
MDLQSLTVVLGLNIEGSGLVLEKLDFLLACEHGTDGVEELNLVIKRNFGVLEFLANLKQTACNIIVLIAIGVESRKYALQLDPQLQIFKNDTHNPLHLSRIGFLEQIQKTLLLVSSISQHVQNLVESFDSEG